jgi:hypothetical protein
VLYKTKFNLSFIDTRKSKARKASHGKRVHGNYEVRSPKAIAMSQKYVFYSYAREYRQNYIHNSKHLYSNHLSDLVSRSDLFSITLVLQSSYPSLPNPKLSSTHLYGTAPQHIQSSSFIHATNTNTRIPTSTVAPAAKVRRGVPNCEI